MTLTSPAELSPYNIRASHYFVLEASCLCKACKHPTQVIALALPPNHQCLESDVLQLDDDDDTSGLGAEAFRDWLFAPEQWYDITGPAIIMTVATLSETVATHLQATYPHYAQSGEGHARYWRNHCQQCGASIGDGELHGNTTSIFSPKDAQAASAITLHHVNAPFEAYYGMCWNEGYHMKEALFERIYNAQS